MARKPQRPRGLKHILKSETNKRRSAPKLVATSHETLRRASPTENVRMGYSPKARRYVKKGVRKITKTTASVSARQAETKRLKKLYGLASPEIATEARRHGAIRYETTQAAETARKTGEASYFKRLNKAGQSRRRIVGEYNVGGKQSFKATPEKASRIARLRARKLGGEFIEDQGEWFMMVRFAEDLGDPALHILRSSVNSDSGEEYADE
jgi:hypothetical protein